MRLGLILNIQVVFYLLESSFILLKIRLYMFSS